MNRCLGFAAIFLGLGWLSPVSAQTFFPFLLNVQQQGTNTSVPNGTVVNFVPPAAGATATATFVITYNGATSATILPGVQITGSSAFSVASSQSQLPPIILGPSASYSLSVTFTPTSSNTDEQAQLLLNYSEAPATSTDATRTGAIVFGLHGVGQKLGYTYTTGSVTNTIQLTDPTVLFSPVSIGQSSQTQFTVQNNGTASVNLISIGVTDTKGVFRLQSPPGLPISLAPAASITFPIIFAPLTTGQSTSQLLVNNQSFTLTGFGNPPAALPAYTFSGVSGQVQPFQQPAIRLSLQAPYAIPITGTLTMAVTSDNFTTDPAVLFSSGARTVNFTIPANTTDAIFPSGSNSIQLQTGTVAGTITITPSFATQSGLDLTPSSPTKLTLTIPPLAPTLFSVTPSNVSATGFILKLSGYTTTRSLTRLAFQFTALPGIQLTGNQVSIDISSASNLWFQSTASQAFGGQFSVAVPFTMTSSNTSVVNLLDSVSVVASNATGSSAAVTASLH